MADINKLKPFILKWEGGFVDDPADLGGATNKGVTLKTYKQYCENKGKPVPSVDDLKNLSDEEWTDIFRTMYWDKWKADQIENQSIANILVDWVWASGKKGIEIPQALLGVAVDGKVGNATLAAVNGRSSQQELFEKINKPASTTWTRYAANAPPTRNSATAGVTASMRSSLRGER